MTWTEYGPWILSILALSQFWIWLALKRKGGRRLQAYESGSVEIGFDVNGPIIALAGVLRPLQEEVFVQSMHLTLTSEKDKSRREFGWIAFKPNFLLPLAGNRAWEMAHPFLVSPGDTHRFNVVFQDVEAAREMKSVLQGYYHHWHETESRIKEKGQHPDAELVAEFKRKDICVSSYTELDRTCYWETGAYSLSLRVKTEKGDADFARQFKFTLGKADAKQLKINCVSILEEPICAALGKPPMPCRTVQAEYARIA